MRTEVLVLISVAAAVGCATGSGHVDRPINPIMTPGTFDDLLAAAGSEVRETNIGECRTALPDSVALVSPGTKRNDRIVINDEELRWWPSEPDTIWAAMVTAHCLKHHGGLVYMTFEWAGKRFALNINPTKQGDRLSGLYTATGDGLTPYIWPGQPGRIEELRAARKAEIERLLADGWTRHQISMVRAGKVSIGMTKEMVRMAWGRPTSINSTRTARHVSEQWVYRGGRYVYFLNGVVDAIQETR